MAELGITEVTEGGPATQVPGSEQAANVGVAVGVAVAVAVGVAVAVTVGVAVMVTVALAVAVGVEVAVAVGVAMGLPWPSPANLTVKTLLLALSTTTSFADFLPSESGVNTMVTVQSLSPGIAPVQFPDGTNSPSVVLTEAIFMAFEFGL